MYYSQGELYDAGFSHVGERVRISKKCSLYSVSGAIGDDTRIDDFCILKGAFEIGSKVHICSHSSLSAVGGVITIEALAGIGVNNIFYTTSDDLLVSALCGPLVARENTATKSGDIFIGRGAALGGRVTVFPSVQIGEFTAVGVGGVVTANLSPSSLYATINGRLRRVAARNHEQLARLAELELGKS